MEVPKSMFKNSAYTLTEIIIVLLVIAVIVAVSIRITKAKLDNIVSYTYYSAYSTLRQVSRQMLSDFDANDDKYILSMNFLGHFFTNPVLAYDSNNCFVEYEDSINNKKYCINYYLESYCNYKDFDCESYIGRYGITAELCNSKPISSYNLYKTQGKFYPNPIGVQELFNKINSTAPITTRPLFMLLGDAQVNTTSICKFIWDGQQLENTGWMGCGEGYTDRYCNDGYSTLIISHEEEDMEPEPDPVPEPGLDPDSGAGIPICNLPSTSEQERAYCLNGYSDFDSSPEVCDYTTKPGSWPPSCESGYRWNNAETDCKCIPESRTLPRNGQNFCELFVSYTNTKSNSSECTGDAISSDITDFDRKTADITLRNGMRLYNVRQNPQEIAVLAHNTDGGSYDGVPNINTFGYTVYVDIDGFNGSSTLWEDVYPFYITMSGLVIPGYDVAHPGVSGGDSRNHLMVSVEEERYDSGSRKIQWLKKSVSFKEGACSSGFISSSTPYCEGVALERTCGSDNSSNLCSLKHIRPLKFFF